MPREIPDLVWTPRNGDHWIAARRHRIRQFLNEPEHFSARRLDLEWDVV